MIMCGTQCVAMCGDLLELHPKRFICVLHRREMRLECRTLGLSRSHLGVVGELLLVLLGGGRPTTLPLATLSREHLPEGKR